MLEILGYILLAIGLIVACRFVNGAKDNHGACCGRGCAGCKRYEQEREKKLNSHN